jgi:ATP-binding protein involved in chromosome partitioning
VLQKEIEAILASYRDPDLESDFFSIKAIKKIAVTSHHITIDIVLPYPCQRVLEEKVIQLQTLLAPVAGDKAIAIHFSTHIEKHSGQSGLAVWPQIKNMIAVASGKGGVGKSTVAINLALGLAQEGAQVGILDADIYGPSQPAMLGVKEGQRPVIHNKTLLPVKRHGLQSMSMGYLVQPHTAMVWRGPMVGKAIQQLLQDTVWDALDYLIIDLPPGTGDIQLTLGQKMPLSAAVMVTTPQDLALLDVRRACDMLQKLNVPLLGIVENMSGYHCQQCGHAESIFGRGGGQTLAEAYELPLLASIPLAMAIREMTDSGSPPVVQSPESSYAKLFCELARKVGAKLALQKPDYSSRFPKVVIQHESSGEGIKKDEH